MTAPSVSKGWNCAVLILATRRSAGLTGAIVTLIASAPYTLSVLLRLPLRILVMTEDGDDGRLGLRQTQHIGTVDAHEVATILVLQMPVDMGKAESRRQFLHLEPGEHSPLETLIGIEANKIGHLSDHILAGCEDIGLRFRRDLRRKMKMIDDPCRIQGCEGVVVG